MAPGSSTSPQCQAEVSHRVVVSPLGAAVDVTAPLGSSRAQFAWNSVRQRPTAAWPHRGRRGPCTRLTSPSSVVGVPLLVSVAAGVVRVLWVAWRGGESARNWSPSHHVRRQLPVRQRQGHTAGPPTRHTARTRRGEGPTNAHPTGGGGGGWRACGWRPPLISVCSFSFGAALSFGGMAASGSGMTRRPAPPHALGGAVSLLSSSGLSLLAGGSSLGLPHSLLDFGVRAGPSWPAQPKRRNEHHQRGKGEEEQTPGAGGGWKMANGRGTSAHPDSGPFAAFARCSAGVVELTMRSYRLCPGQAVPLSSSRVPYNASCRPRPRCTTGCSSRPRWPPLPVRLPHPTALRPRSRRLPVQRRCAPRRVRRES